MALSQQPIGCEFFAWFSIVPLIKVLDDSKLIKEKLFFAFIWGFIYHASTIYWIFFNLGTNRTIGFISLLAAVLVLTFNIILIVLLFSIISKKIFTKTYILLPIIWVSVEYVRTFSILGFPWTSLANSQVHYNLLAQNVEFTGIYGISFWLVLLNVFIYDFYKNIDFKTALILIIIFLFPWVSGYYLYSKQIINVKDGLDIVLVQPNISLAEKRSYHFFPDNIKKMVTLALAEINDDTELILFPESALSSYMIEKGSYLRFIQRSILNQNMSLLSGLNYSKVYSGEKLNYNSLAHIDSNRIVDLYHKINLVPIAEYTPLSSIFPSLKSINIGQANFEPGREHTIFDINNYKVAGLICYESTFPQLNRKFINNGAEILMYFVNDGWYETAPEPQQHAKQAIYRAIEFRRPVVRCANTGISTIINKKGEITNRIGLNKEGSIAANIIPSSTITFYAKYGDVFAIINIVLLFILLGLNFNRKV